MPGTRYPLQMWPEMQACLYHAWQIGPTAVNTVPTTFLNSVFVF